MRNEDFKKTLYICIDHEDVLHVLLLLKTHCFENCSTFSNTFLSFIYIMSDVAERADAASSLKK